MDRLTRVSTVSGEAHALQEVLMKNDQSKGCSHLGNLPSLPAPTDLALRRKGLRKRKVPIESADFNGQHAKLGGFQFSGDTNLKDLFVTWNVGRGVVREDRFEALCLEPSRELDRLALGWLIANVHALDGMHQFEAIPGPKEAMQFLNWFGMRENRWRHWAIVPAGHMLMQWCVSPAKKPDAGVSSRRGN